MSATALPVQSSDFPAWYGGVVRRAGLAENSSIRGAMVIKPYGYAIQAAAAVADGLRAAGVRVRVDDRPEYRPGFKFTEWELKGVPLRIELGSRDLVAGAVTVARRDTASGSRSRFLAWLSRSTSC